MHVLSLLYCVFKFVNLLVAEGDTSFREVVRTHFDFDTVTGEDLDVMHTHLAGDVGDDERSVLELHAEHSVGQCLYYRSIYFDAVLFCHNLFILDESVSQNLLDVVKGG